MNYLYLILGRDRKGFYVYFNANTFKVTRIVPENVFNFDEALSAESIDIYTNLYSSEAQRHIDLYSARKAKDMLSK